jgi:hypothetical protein
MSQDQLYQGKPTDPSENYRQTTLKGPDKLKPLDDLLQGIDGLVSRENLADKYVQSGGQ